jgi:hypothetical protein
MEKVREDAIGGFNTFLEEQKKLPGCALMTLVQFDTQYDVIHSGKDIQKVPPLTRSTFVPRGNTALYDSIGKTLNEVGARLAATPENKRPGKVIVVISTDGEENSSREFRGEAGHQQVMQMIDHQQKTYGWNFIFLGAKQDAIQAGASIGVSAANALSVADNAKGTTHAYAAVSANTRRYRQTGDADDLKFSTAQRVAQRDAGANADALNQDKPGQV